MEAIASCYIAIIGPTPTLPLAFDQGVEPFVALVAAQRHHLRLQSDPLADNVDLRRPLGLASIWIVTHHLARAITQLAQACLDLRVGAGAVSNPVACQAIDDCTRIGAATTTRLLRCCRLRAKSKSRQKSSANTHQRPNLT